MKTETKVILENEDWRKLTGGEKIAITCGCGQVVELHYDSTDTSEVIKDHNNNITLCPYCEKRYSTILSLNGHIHRLHRNKITEKHICGKRKLRYTKDSLNIHMNTVHGGKK